MPRRGSQAPIKPGYWVDKETRDAWDAAEAKREAKRDAAKRRKLQLKVGSHVKWPSRYTAPQGVVVELLPNDRAMVRFADDRTIPVRRAFLVAVSAMSVSA